MNRPKGGFSAWTRTISLAALGLMVIACGGGGTQSGPASVTMKVGHDSPTDFPYQLAAVEFKKEVESQTSGRVKVTIYPNAQLGDEATMVNGLKVGAVDGYYGSIFPLVTSIPQMDLLNLPFLFKDTDHAIRVLNGPVGNQLKDKVLSATGAELAGWAVIGERDMWNSQRPIHTPADVRGLKMRVPPGSAITIDTYTSLGALATPVSFNDLFGALQNHVVDGADNGPLDIEGSKFYQVTKYVSLTKHFVTVTPMLISDKFLAKLSSQDRKTVLDIGRKTVVIVTEQGKKQNNDTVAQLKQQGLQFIDISTSDHQAFVQAVQTVYTKDADKVGGLQVIQQAMNTP